MDCNRIEINFLLFEHVYKWNELDMIIRNALTLKYHSATGSKDTRKTSFGVESYNLRMSVL